MLFRCPGCSKSTLLHTYCAACTAVLQPHPTWWPSPTTAVRRVFSLHTLRDSNMAPLYAYKNHSGKAIRSALAFDRLHQCIDPRSIYDFIAPVPDDKSRIWRRRHSPAWHLAQHASRLLHSPVVEILERQTKTKDKQALLTGLARRLDPPQWRMNTSDEAHLPRANTALIVDDFIVSGTTICGIAEVLRERFGPNLTIDAMCLGIRRIRKELDQTIGQ